MEQVARTLAAQGCPVWLQATIAHRGLLGPVLLHLGLAATALALGLGSFPLVGALLAVVQLGCLVIDLDGGQSPVRRVLPRQPGWGAEIELQPGSDHGPTLLLYMPMGAGLTASTSEAWGPQLAEAALVLAQSVRVHPPGEVRILLLLGADGPTWFDDLEILLRNRRHRHNPRRTALLALRPSSGAPALLDPEGLAGSRRAPADLLAALASLGLPTRRGRSGASRARRLGIRAIGLSLDPTQPQELALRLTTALRCLARIPGPETA